MTPARILIIEDNTESLELMRYLLHAFGYTPLTAVTGPAGLELIKKERPDLVICDIHLPLLDGYEIARRLKSSHTFQRIPLVAVTALAMVGDRDKILEAGFDGYISKPIEPETFVRQVEAFLGPSVLATAPRPTPMSPAMAEEGPRRQAHAHILLVDDRAQNIDVLRAMLEPSGYAVTAANDAASALALCQQHKPDLIICDLHMPSSLGALSAPLSVAGETPVSRVREESGYELVRAVKADPDLHAIPCVLISSTSWCERDVAKALQAGAVKYLKRPIEPLALLAALESCLEQTPGAK